MFYVTAIGCSSTQTLVSFTDRQLHWLDGSAVDFTYFQPGEPNGEDNGEDCMEFPVSVSLFS